MCLSALLSKNRLMYCTKHVKAFELYTNSNTALITNLRRTEVHGVIEPAFTEMKALNTYFSNRFMKHFDLTFVTVTLYAIFNLKFNVFNLSHRNIDHWIELNNRHATVVT